MLLIAALMTVFLSSPSPPPSGAIRGRVELRQPPADHEPRPNVADLGMHTGHGPTDRRRSVVYLDVGDMDPFELSIDQPVTDIVEEIREVLDSMRQRPTR